MSMTPEEIAKLDAYERSRGNLTGPSAGATSSPKRRVSPELNQASNELGVDMSALNGGGGYQDPEDPDAWFQGKVHKTSSLLNQFWVLTEAQLTSFQDDAVRGGYIDGKKLRRGAYDGDTFSVWKEMVFASAGYMANGRKVGPLKAMKELADRTPGDFSSGDAAVPPAAIVSNPATIKANLKTAAQSVLGVAVDEAKLDQITALFQAAQERAQLSAGNAQRTGGTSVAAPEFGDFAERQLREVDPLKADARKKLKVVSVLQRMMATDPLQQRPAVPGEVA